MDKMEEARRIARNIDAFGIINRPDWNGCEVWEILFDDPEEEAICTGYPQYIIFYGNEYRLSSDAEAMDYMSYLNDEYGEIEEGEIIPI